MKKVFIYRNLHKKCWSVKQNGKVINHTSKIILMDCEFIVQPAGHAKVLKEKKKNVHAFVKGEIFSEDGNTYDLNGMQFTRNQI